MNFHYPHVTLFSSRVKYARIINGRASGRLTTEQAAKALKSLGGFSGAVPPVPIPNTEVKRFSADDTEGATPCGKYATARGL